MLRYSNKTIPPLFAQLYTIHGLINNNIVPAVFVLKSENTEESYQMVFSKLKQLEPSMRPISVMTDFKTTTMKAFQHEFIEIQLRMVFFLHFCHYENDADFAMQMRHLPSLAFVPVEDVVLAFEELLSSVDFHLESQPVPDYFEDTWIGGPTRGNYCRPPRLNEAKIEQSLAGQPIQPQKKRYRDAASRIKKIVETYKEIDLMDYLRGLSHNLSF
ncbi:hypothetical protein ACJMK2_018491 [Sinanodonta woodiana]|uniref:MULE transposase domain-containing protein n=1 Tax=Sinanodonta woodiana TaxID=1069815 RepID=A0ABD3UGP5_SINWO